MQAKTPRILVVDDEHGIREGCRKILIAQGYEVETAEDGVAGLELFKRERAFDAALVGRQGKALSDLKPSGHIMLGQDRHQAVSQAGYIEKGTPIEVIGGRGAYLIVKRVKEEEGL